MSTGNDVLVCFEQRTFMFMQISCFFVMFRIFCLIICLATEFLKEHAVLRWNWLFQLMQNVPLFKSKHQLPSAWINTSSGKFRFKKSSFQIRADLKYQIAWKLCRASGSFTSSHRSKGESKLTFAKRLHLFSGEPLFPEIRSVVENIAWSRRHLTFRMVVMVPECGVY